MKHGGAKTILAAQLARFGDFLQSTPLLAALKDKHPGARLTVLVDAGQADLARTNPDIEEVWSVDLNKLRALARSRSNLSDILHRTQSELSFLSGRSFDLVINLNTSRTAALLCALIPGEKRLGPALAADRSSIETAPWTGFIMNLMKHRPMIRFNLVDLLTCYAGLEKRPSETLIYQVGPEARARSRELIGPRPDGPLIGFQMGSKHLSRQWPPENFALLARDLISEHGARNRASGRRNGNTPGPDHEGRTGANSSLSPPGHRPDGPDHTSRIWAGCWPAWIFWRPRTPGPCIWLRPVKNADPGPVHGPGPLP